MKSSFHKAYVDKGKPQVMHDPILNFFNGGFLMPAKNGGKPLPIFLNLPRYKKPNNYGFSPYIYGSKPDASVTVFGGGLEGRMRFNNRFGITGGANLTNVLFPGGNQQQFSYNVGANVGLGNRQAPPLQKTPGFDYGGNVGVYGYRNYDNNYLLNKAKGGDVSIPDLTPNNWITKYDPGGPVKCKPGEININGRCIRIDSKEYRQLYNKGVGRWMVLNPQSNQWMASDQTNPNAEFVTNFVPLDEVTVKAKLNPYVSRGRKLAKEQVGSFDAFRQQELAEYPSWYRGSSLYNPEKDLATQKQKYDQAIARASYQNVIDAIPQREGEDRLAYIERLNREAGPNFVNLARQQGLTEPFAPANFDLMKQWGQKGFNHLLGLGSAATNPAMAAPQIFSAIQRGNQPVKGLTAEEAKEVGITQPFESLDRAAFKYLFEPALAAGDNFVDPAGKQRRYLQNRYLGPSQSDLLFTGLVNPINYFGPGLLKYGTKGLSYGLRGVGELSNFAAKLPTHPLVVSLPSVIKNSAYKPYAEALFWGAADNLGSVASKTPGLKNLYKKSAEIVAGASPQSFRSGREIKDAFVDYFMGRVPNYTGAGKVGVDVHMVDPNRNAIRNFIYGDSRGFVPSEIKTQGLEKYEDMYGPLKKYQLDISSIGDVPYTYQDFRTYNKEILKDLNILNKDNLFDIANLDEYNTLKDYLKNRKESLSVKAETGFLGVDDIGGHLKFLRYDPESDQIMMKTQDIWKFTPKDYGVRYSGDLSTLRSNIQNKEGLKEYLNTYRRTKQASLMDRAGKPFVLLDERPLIYNHNVENKPFSGIYKDPQWEVNYSPEEWAQLLKESAEQVVKMQAKKPGFTFRPQPPSSNLVIPKLKKQGGLVKYDLGGSTDCLCPEYDCQCPPGYKPRVQQNVYHATNINHHADKQVPNYTYLANINSIGNLAYKYQNKKSDKSSLSKENPQKFLKKVDEYISKANERILKNANKYWKEQMMDPYVRQLVLYDPTAYQTLRLESYRHARADAKILKEKACVAGFGFHWDDEKQTCVRDYTVQATSGKDAERVLNPMAYRELLSGKIASLDLDKQDQTIEKVFPKSGVTFDRRYGKQNLPIYIDRAVVPYNDNFNDLELQQVLPETVSLKSIAYSHPTDVKTVNDYSVQENYQRYKNEEAINIIGKKGLKGFIKPGTYGEALRRQVDDISEQAPGDPLDKSRLLNLFNNASIFDRSANWLQTGVNAASEKDPSFFNRLAVGTFNDALTAGRLLKSSGSLKGMAKELEGMVKDQQNRPVNNIGILGFSNAPNLYQSGVNLANSAKNLAEDPNFDRLGNVVLNTLAIPFQAFLTSPGGFGFAGRTPAKSFLKNPVRVIKEVPRNIIGNYAGKSVLKNVGTAAGIPVRAVAQTYWNPATALTAFGSRSPAMFRIGSDVWDENTGTNPFAFLPDPIPESFYEPGQTKLPTLSEIQSNSVLPKAYLDGKDTTYTVKIGNNIYSLDTKDPDQKELIKQYIPVAPKNYDTKTKMFVPEINANDIPVYEDILQNYIKKNQ